jgi:hypothetical protein
MVNDALFWQHRPAMHAGKIKAEFRLRQFCSMLGGGGLVVDSLARRAGGCGPNGDSGKIDLDQ